MLLRQKQQLPQAIRRLRANLALRPEDPTLNYLLADTLIRTQAEPGQPAFEEAVSLLTRVIRLEPAFQKAHVTLGKLYLRAERPRQAEQQLREAVRLDPHDRSAVSQLVVLLRSEGNRKEAALWANKLRELVASDAAASDPGRFAEAALDAGSQHTPVR
jgi:Flp pilus assembly protein TadD